MNTDDLYSGGAALDSQLEPYSDITHYNSASATENNAMDTQQLSDNQAQEDEEDSDSIEEQEDEDDLSILMRSWINERSSPELLEYEGSALENLMELVDFQMQKIQTQQVPFIGNILKMDVDRIKYLVRSYLRTRLGKIEDHV
ncbi:GINS complex subunit, partial [Kickxella alabastrina]